MFQVSVIVWMKYKDNMQSTDCMICHKEVGKSKITMISNGQKVVMHPECMSGNKVASPAIFIDGTNITFRSRED